MSLATGAVDIEAARRPSTTTQIRQLATTVGLATLSAVIVSSFGPMLGMRVPAIPLLILAGGAVAVERAGSRAFEATSVVGLLLLFATNKVHAAYHLAVVVSLFLVRRRPAAMVLVLVTLTILLPKYLFFVHYASPGAYNWINEPSVALIFFVTLCWVRDRHDGRLPAAGERAGLLTWSAQFLFPGHAVNPMLFTAGTLFAARRIDPSAVVAAAGSIAAKALVHVALAELLPDTSYATLDSSRASALSWAGLWAVVLIGYVDLAVVLSGTADVAILLARLYGWPLESPFRWALLAWNPVELWRRWGVYNRKVLLKLVYFPLGGRRMRFLNVLLTFLASAWLLHSGWFGSKYWSVGAPGWRDQGAYFLVQGAIVCVWLLIDGWRRPRANPGREAGIRWSWARVSGTAATQAAAALAHVVILAQALPFSERFAVIARCLGLAGQ
jgi:hypothetical protein